MCNRNYELFAIPSNACRNCTKCSKKANPTNSVRSGSQYTCSNQLLPLSPRVKIILKLSLKVPENYFSKTLKEEQNKCTLKKQQKLDQSILSTNLCLGDKHSRASPDLAELALSRYIISNGRSFQLSFRLLHPTSSKHNPNFTITNQVMLNLNYFYIKFLYKQLLH